MIAFRCGYDDAEILERQFGREYPAARLVELGNYHVLARVRAASGFSPAVMVHTLPPIVRSCGHAELIKALSRRHYSVSQAEIENRIQRWMGGQ